MKVVIIGAGDIGQHLASKMSSENNDVVLVDLNEDLLAAVEEKLDIQTLVGNGGSRSVLQKAKASSADVVLAVTGSDHTNMLSAALARSLGADRTIARVDDPEFYIDQLGIERNIMGVSAAICSSRLISNEFQRLIQGQGCKYLGYFADNQIAVGIIQLTPSFRHFDKKLGAIKVGKNFSIVGCIRNGKFFSSDEVGLVFEGDQLLIVSSKYKFGLGLRRLSEKFGAGKVCVVGGGDVGGDLSRLLAKECTKLVVIDSNRGRCEDLSETLDGVTILNGDGTNISFLSEEGIQYMDFLVSVTKADEVNLMSSLLGKELGIEQTLSLVHRPDYSKVYERLGVSGTTSAQELFWEQFNRLNSKKLVIRVDQLQFCNLEFVEVYLPLNWQKVNVKGWDLALSAGAILLGSYSDGKMVEPRETYLSAGSTLIFLAPIGKSDIINSLLAKVL